LTGVNLRPPLIGEPETMVANEIRDLLSFILLSECIPVHPRASAVPNSIFNFSTSMRVVDARPSGLAQHGRVNSH
jgi:hypothetical protein